MVPCLPGINKIILNVGNFTTLSLFCAVGWDEMWDGESVDFQRCPWNRTADIHQSILQYRMDWLCLDCILHVAPSKKHWNSNRICPSLNIWIQVETFMGNYINTLVSWIPSKYRKSRYLQLDKIHFRAVVTKVNHEVSLQSLCFILVRRGLFFISPYFVQVLAWLERALLLTCSAEYNLWILFRYKSWDMQYRT